MTVLNYLMARMLPDHPSDLDIWIASFCIFLGAFWAVGAVVFVIKEMLP